MYPPMIPGSCTARLSWPGRDGIPIREFGMADRTSSSAQASVSGSSAALGGAGATGVTIGTTTMQFTTTSGTSLTAPPSITAMSITAAVVAAQALPDGADSGPRIGVSRLTATSTTARAALPGRLRETTTRHAGLLNLAEKATSTPERLA